MTGASEATCCCPRTSEPTIAYSRRFQSRSVRSRVDAPRIFAHLDPYLPFANDDDGRNTVDLFCELTEKGALVMMWYGFSSDEERAPQVSYHLLGK